MRHGYAWNTHEIRMDASVCCILMGYITDTHEIRMRYVYPVSRETVCGTLKLCYVWSVVHFSGIRVSYAYPLRILCVSCTYLLRIMSARSGYAYPTCILFRIASYPNVSCVSWRTCIDCEYLLRILCVSLTYLKRILTYSIGYAYLGRILPYPKVRYLGYAGYS